MVEIKEIKFNSRLGLYEIWVDKTFGILATEEELSDKKKLFAKIKKKCKEKRDAEKDLERKKKKLKEFKKLEGERVKAFLRNSKNTSVSKRRS